ncbi:MAG: hypothetical protein MUE52_12230 [Tabrizicola sp.]|jgi:hypothetical protein|nr:hypothetical protein [Tabrizicola sp.]
MALIAVQLAGILLSALLVAATFLDRAAVGSLVQGFAVAKVESAADLAWNEASSQFGTGDRAERLGALAERLGIDAQTAEAERREIVPALMAYALSDRCGNSCGLAALAADAADHALIARVAKLRMGQVTLGEFIVERYDSTLIGLINDLRRFGATNLVALSLMLGLTTFRNYLNWRFVAFSIAVTVYTAVASYNYLVAQNWAMTLILHDWTSPAYQIGMLFACLVFADWLFLNGRLTRLVLDLIGSAASG